MKICSVKIENYRTIEELVLEIKSGYVAISGKNNSGKTNVVRAIRAFFESPERSVFMDEQSINVNSDYPNWRKVEIDNRHILFSMTLTIDIKFDTGLHRFISTFIPLESPPDSLRLTLGQRWTRGSTRELSLECEGSQVSDKFKIEEIFKKIGSSRCLLFHNSTQQGTRFFLGSRFAQVFGGLPEQTETLKQANKKMQAALSKSAQHHQKSMMELLGRLEDKYHVVLSLPELDFDSIPFTVSLGDRNSTVPLDDWGSGTQNRTLILLSLMRAKLNRDRDSESDRITPIVLVEEPESFLHPSAQSEFGKMLQDLSQELEVQVITTTHSPYMLSMDNPGANILLSRKLDRKRQLATEVLDTKGENWMEPFALALGIDNEGLSNWRQVLFKKSNQLLLVEGEIDKEYLELLRESGHQTRALKFDGEIFPYGGVGFFGNTILLKFLLSRFQKLVITYDLDSDNQVAKQLVGLGLRKGKDFFPIGLDKPGLRDIEGLLPESVRSAVYSENPNLVAHASSTEREKEQARHELKKLLLRKFKEQAKPGEEYYRSFYELTRNLQKAFA